MKVCGLHFASLFLLCAKIDTEANKTEAEKMKNRIDSFRGWKGAKTPVHLAVAGFRYTGMADEVLCDSCGLRVHDWQGEDNAVEIHKRQSSRCSYITKWFESGESTARNNNDDEQNELPVPCHPEYITYEKRLESFFGWPCTPAHQSPPCMAQEGFFYTGSADRVTCFQCGLRLRDWDQSDYPPDCHKQFAPDCPFVKRMDAVGSHGTAVSKGTSSEMLDESEKDSQAEASPQTSMALTVHNGTKNTSKPEQYSEHGTSASTDVMPATSSNIQAVQEPSMFVNWSNPSVQAVLDMGCQRNIIEQVTTEHMRNTGQLFANAVLLYEAILAMESKEL